MASCRTATDTASLHHLPPRHSLPASLPFPARYSDAAAASDWPLVWSVLPLVAPDKAPPAAGAAAAAGWSQLRIKSPPPFAAVAAHLRRIGADGGEEALGSWPAAAGGVEEAFRSVLSYLDREGVSGARGAALREVCFVPVARGTALAAPSRLYVRLRGGELPPFAYEVPPSLSAFTPLLRSLGAQDEPRPQVRGAGCGVRGHRPERGPTCACVVCLFLFLITRVSICAFVLLINTHTQTCGHTQDLLEALRGMAAAAGGAPLNANQRAAVVRLLCQVAGAAGVAAGGAAGPGGGAAGMGHSAADVAALAAARREKRLLVLSADGRWAT